MRATLFAIQSRRLANVLNGDATILVTKYPLHSWIYLYCTKAKPYLAPLVDNQGYFTSRVLFSDTCNGKVVARFYVEESEKFNHTYDLCAYLFQLQRASCMSKDEMRNYAFGQTELYFNHISKLEIFDKPKELGKFERYCPFMSDCGERLCLRNTDKMYCRHEQVDYNPDGSVNLRTCIQTHLAIAPQSHMYINIEE